MSDETGYIIERSTNGTTFAEVASVGANVRAYSNVKLSANTAYYYRVRAYKGAISTAYSNTARAQTLK
jgi:hypothetical protein